MAYKKPKGARVYANVSVELNDEVDRNAAYMAMSKSQFASLLLNLGMAAWNRSYRPEKLLSPEEWAKIFEKVGDDKQQG